MDDVAMTDEELALWRAYWAAWDRGDVEARHEWARRMRPYSEAYLEALEAEGKSAVPPA